MVKKTTFLVERPVFENQNHTENAVKAHGCLFSLISADLANYLHDQALPKPYSISYFSGEKNQKDRLVINTLTDRAAEALPVLISAGALDFFGSKQSSVIIPDDCIKYSEQKVDTLVQAPFITIELMTPATYRNGQYCCWFDLDQLLRTPVNKLKVWLEKDFSFERPVMEQIRIVDYDIKSKPYNINGFINGMSGYVRLSIENSKIKRKLCELLHYCEFTGLGGKTALGMGACKISITGR